MDDNSSNRDRPDDQVQAAETAKPGGTSRRDFLKTGAAGVVAAAVGPALVAGEEVVSARETIPIVELGDGNRKVLKGGVVLSLDSKVGDFEKADVVIEGKKIVAVGPNLGHVSGRQIDCTDTIVLPGFISTHNHQYEVVQRGVIADGLIVFPG